MSADFNDVLSLKPGEIEKPKPRPLGTYIGAIQKYELRDVDTKNGPRKLIEFAVKLIGVQQVDDQEALTEQGDIADWYPLQYTIFYETPEGRYALKNYLTEVLGVDPGSGKNEKTLGEMIAETPGAQLLVTTKHEPYTSKAGTPEIRTGIASVAKV
jgi:hypothetical protein